MAAKVMGAFWDLILKQGKMNQQWVRLSRAAMWRHSSHHGCAQSFPPQQLLRPSYYFQWEGLHCLPWHLGLFTIWLLFYPFYLYLSSDLNLRPVLLQWQAGTPRVSFYTIRPHVAHINHPAWHEWHTSPCLKSYLFFKVQLLSHLLNEVFRYSPKWGNRNFLSHIYVISYLLKHN